MASLGGGSEDDLQRSVLLPCGFWDLHVGWQAWRNVLQTPCFFEPGSWCVAQAALHLAVPLLPTAVITGVCHRAQRECSHCPPGVQRLL